MEVIEIIHTTVNCTFKRLEQLLHDSRKQHEQHDAVLEEKMKNGRIQYLEDELVLQSETLAAMEMVPPPLSAREQGSIKEQRAIINRTKLAIVGVKEHGAYYSLNR